MTYIDGYLTPIRPEMKEKYIEFSRKMAAIYKEYGALRVVDSWQDEAVQDQAEFHAENTRSDYEASETHFRTFAEAAQTEPGELVLFSWTEWPNKEVRDAGLAKVTADPRVQFDEGQEAIFEGRRLIASGFNVIVDV